MVLGAFKVLIVSDALLGWRHRLLAELNATSGFGPLVLTGALVVVGYALFLYANFSSYTDFVIDIARLYRLRLPENLGRPFAALNFIKVAVLADGVLGGDGADDGGSGAGAEHVFAGDCL